MSDEQLALITPSLLDGRPNTYTFTKALGENVLANEGQGLPIAVFRPSIVAGAYQEPLPGWIDVIHGASGLFMAVSDYSACWCGVSHCVSYPPGGHGTAADHEDQVLKCC